MLCSYEGISINKILRLLLDLVLQLIITENNVEAHIMFLNFVIFTTVLVVASSRGKSHFTYNIDAARRLLGR